jgi:ATP-dependent DNA ligase
MMKMPTLYGKDSSGNLKLWEVFTIEDAITVRHGKLGGKIQEKTTKTTPKNEGRANSTTASEQAYLEAEAKWVKQKKKGYCETKEEALNFVNLMPMKAQNFNEYEHKIGYPVYIQPKLNGQRLLLEADGTAQSKQGEDITFPAHWAADIQKLMDLNLIPDGLDGEVFSGYQKQGGLSLQQIIGAFRKPNENTPKLKYYVYDIPSDEPQNVRMGKLMNLEATLLELGIENIVVSDFERAHHQSDADIFYAIWLEDGAEGMVYRNTEGVYEFGKRSYNLIKRKPRQSAEALVLDSVPDKNNAGLLTCQLQNGVKFKCLMRVDSSLDIDYRKHQNALTLIGSHIEFEYEELSDNGVPTKPVGVGVRKVNLNWEPQE